MPSSRLQERLRRATHPLYRRLETTVHPLRYLFIEITQRCNLSCRHCGSDCGRDTQLEELDTAEWMQFFDYLADAFPKRDPILVITGGEPLCHPDFWQLTSRLNALGFKWGIVTNGFLLDQPTAERLVRRGIRNITVSLDGKAESHNWLRGRSGSFQRAMGAVEMLARSNIPFFDVVTCVNPRNLEELPEVLAMLRGAGVKRWRLFSIFPKGRAKENAELLLSNEQLGKMLEWVETKRLELEDTDFHVNFSCEGYLPPELDRAVRDEPYFCRAGIAIGSVLCDGSVSACPNITRSLIQGNIRDDDLMDIWENRFEPFRNRQWMRTGECTDCKEWSRCQGNSLHLWDDEANRTALCHFNIRARQNAKMKSL